SLGREPLREKSSHRTPPPRRSQQVRDADAKHTAPSSADADLRHLSGSGSRRRPVPGRTTTTTRLSEIDSRFALPSISTVTATVKLVSPIADGRSASSFKLQPDFTLQPDLKLPMLFAPTSVAIGSTADRQPMSPASSPVTKAQKPFAG